MAEAQIIKSPKNYAIESLRFIAAFAVINIHYFYPKDHTWQLLVNQLSRFAVPFFFVVSGFFLAEKLKKEDTFIIYWKYFKKVVFLYFAWQLIYFLNPKPGEIYLRGITEAYLRHWRPVFNQSWDLILFKGFAQHLWFFLSLGLTVMYFFIFRLKRVYWMVGISFLLYIIGALTKAYSGARYGIEMKDVCFAGECMPKHFNTNNLIFFSAFPFSLGVLFSAKKINVSLYWSWVILLLGFGLHFLELGFLQELKLRARVDYVFSTWLMGLGAFLVAKAHFKPLEWKPLAALGQFSLGIYAMHILVANYANYYILNNYKPYNHLTIPLITLVICVLVTWLFSKIPLIKRLV